MKKIFKTIPYIIISILVGVTVVYAGNLISPGSPSKTMKSLSDLYELIDTGSNTPSSSFNTPSSVSSTMNSIGDVYDLMIDKIELINSSKENILSGTSLFGVDGTMPSKVGSATIFTPTISDQAITQGYYGGVVGDGKISGDANLVADNIKNGVSIFGVSGNLSTGTNYSLPKTDQIGCWDSTGTSISCTGTGQDGDTRKGFSGTRFTNNGDGTTTDNATGLIWQRQDNNTKYAWGSAFTYCNNNTAGLSGSGWRLPNIKELMSIVNYQNYTPAIDLTNFPNTKSSIYWSSSTVHSSSYNGLSWIVNYNDGSVGETDKEMFNQYVRCVR